LFVASISCPSTARICGGVQRVQDRDDVVLPTDPLQELAACPKARSASIHDRCKAVYSQLLP
jgi:hypothetical protein